MVGCAFMNQADTKAYREIFKVLKDETQGDPFQAYMGDWDGAMRAAVRTEFPAARIYGCLFHFSQAVLRKASSNEVGLAAEIRRPGEIYKQFLGLAAIPLLPASDIVELKQSASLLGSVHFLF